MFRRIRPAPLKYAWDFYHQKRSTLADDEGRLTVMMENIITIKTLWEVLNQFSLEALKDEGLGAPFQEGCEARVGGFPQRRGRKLDFRVPNAQSVEFWRKTLLIAVGEQFADAIEPGDDLCGVSFSSCFNSIFITIWNRDGDNQASIDGILSIMLEKISQNLKPKDGSWYYKKHCTHAGFSEVVAKSREV